MLGISARQLLNTCGVSKKRVKDHIYDKSSVALLCCGDDQKKKKVKGHIYEYGTAVLRG